MKKILKFYIFIIISLIIFDDLKAAGICTIDQKVKTLNVGDEVYANAIYRGRKRSVQGTIMAAYKDPLYL